MAVATSSTSIFPLFTSLAPELRDQIWHSALPGKVGPFLYFYSYKKRCWDVRPLSPSDPEWGMTSSDDESCLKLEFRHDLFDSVQVEVPLFFVNREARKIAQAWIHEHGIETRVYPSIDRGLQPPVFVSPFDLALDTLYVTIDQVADFLSEPDLRLCQDDLVDKFYHHWADNITRIAMPQEVFQGMLPPSSNWLGGEVAPVLAQLIGYNDFFGCVKVLYVIVDTPLALKPANNDMKMQPGWKLENIKGEGAFVWDHERGQFNYNKSQPIIDEALHKLFQGINNSLAEQLVQDSGRSFEVRPVFAVRV